MGFRTSGMIAHKTPLKIAVIGSGISGLGASWALSRRHDVTLFERDSRPGGHANTQIARLDGCEVPVDTGFIVYNTVNYPHLVRLFETLDVATDASDMSFAVSLQGGAWEMAGHLTGLFGSTDQFTSREHWGLLADTVRFFRQAEQALSDPATRDERLGSWLDRNAYGAPFVTRFLVPMAAAIWSSSATGILDYPVRPFVRFFHNHGLLRLVNRIPWRTVKGGSQAYVSRLIDDMQAEIVFNAEIAQVTATPTGPCIIEVNGNRRNFDAVLLACHADHAHALLESDSDGERRAFLEAFSYQPNEAVLHTDAALMPNRRRLWSSWNYSSCGDGTGDHPIALTYWMNRLQNITTSDQVFVTLNPSTEPDPATVMTRISYDHPQFDLSALAAQQSLPEIQGRDGIWFAGSYTGYGFHEDGLRSGLQVADALGAPAPWWSDVDKKLSPSTSLQPSMAEAA